MRVLYVCTGNSFRSPAAEALTRLEHPGFEVESRGTNAVGFISGPTMNYLKDHGALEFVKPEPDQISSRALQEADRIICMMPEHREHIMENFEADPAKIKVWNVRDGIEPGVEPWSQLQKIHHKVKELEK